MAALVAGALTIVYAILIVGSQITSLLKDGSWPPVPLSTFINMPTHERDAIYATASVNAIGRSPLASVVDGLLRVPAIVPLLLALALLTVFYQWLTHIERRY
jgi:hypothetical protein